MMRIRIDGGALTSEQLRVIAEISTTYGRDVADITDRQNVQLHWIRVEDVPAIWAQARGRRPVHHRGLRRHAPGDARLPAGGRRRRLGPRRQRRRCDETVEKYLGDPAFSNLPRKFKTSISGCARHCTNHEINDVSFVGVIGPDGTPGFDLWVGGGLSTNPRSPSASACSCGRTRSATSGPASLGSSATTATGARATTPG